MATSDIVQFWDAHPCGGEGTFRQRAQFRYQCEPWLEPLVREVAQSHQKILEIGCGQGRDGCYLAASLASGGRYLGIDASPESVRTAADNLAEAERALTFRVRPEFVVGDAGDLQLPGNEFDCAFSIGVMHHTPSTATCVEQAFDVLHPGGVAYIALYRKYSPKVTVAKTLRQLQRGIDLLTSGDRSIYRFIKRFGKSKLFGTMFLECFGVPHMDWFSRREIEQMFRRFEILDLQTVGGNVWRGGPGPNRWGYMWLVKARKPLK